MFGSKKKPAPAVLTVAEKRRIYPTGRNAIWGDKFRTIAFSIQDAPQMGRTYLKAVLRPDTGKWAVLTVTEGQAAGEASTEIKETAKDLTFFEAAEVLSKFESTESDPLRSRVSDPKEIETLGFEHYERFCHREGLVFDVAALPYETNDGEMILAGAFKQQEISDFNRDFLPLRNKLKAEFSAASSNDFLRSLMPDAGNAAKSLQGLVNTLKAGAQMKDDCSTLVVLLEKARVKWVNLLKEGWGHSYVSEAEGDLDAAEKIVRALGDSVDPAPLLRGVEIFRFALNFSACRYASSRALQGDADYIGVLENKIPLLKSRCEESLRKLNVSDIEALGLESGMITNLSDAKPYPVVEEFITSCRTLRDQMTKAIDGEIKKIGEKVVPPSPQ